MLKKQREIPKYRYVYINNKKIYIDCDLAKELDKIDNRFKYLKRLDNQKGTIFISAYDSDGFNALEAIPDTRENALTIYERKEMVTTVNNCIEKLSKNEQEIIFYIYFKGYSLSKIAKIKNTYPMSICRQHTAILAKLRKVLIECKLEF